MWESRFSWVEPLNPTIWSLFDIGQNVGPKPANFTARAEVTDPSFDTLLTPTVLTLVLQAFCLNSWTLRVAET
jgi:hypothetical protein